MNNISIWVSYDGTSFVKLGSVDVYSGTKLELKFEVKPAKECIDYEGE